MQKALQYKKSKIKLEALPFMEGSIWIFLEESWSILTKNVRTVLYRIRRCVRHAIIK